MKDLRKRLLAAAMTVSLLAVPVVPAYAESTGYDNFTKRADYTEQHYRDVHSGDWFHDNVKSTYETQLMVGTGARSFSPYSNVTWAQAVTLLARIHSIYTGDHYDFSLRKGDSWYDPYLRYAETLRLFNRYDFNGDFNANIKRAFFVEMITAALPDSAYTRINEIKNYSIPDVSGNTTYYDDVMLFYRAGILSGNDQYGFFKPYSDITRAECAAIVTRIADPALRNRFRLAEYNGMGGVYYHINNADPDMDSYSYGSWILLEENHDRDGDVPWSSIMAYDIYFGDESDYFREGIESIVYSRAWRDEQQGIREGWLKAGSRLFEAEISDDQGTFDISSNLRVISMYSVPEKSIFSKDFRFGEDGKLLGIIR